MIGPSAPERCKRVSHLRRNEFWFQRPLEQKGKENAAQRRDKEGRGNHFKDCRSNHPIRLLPPSVLAGSIALAALFHLMGALVRRPAVVGLVYIFFFETLVANLPGSQRQCGRAGMR